MDPGGIEPPALRLRGGCSAVELRVQIGDMVHPNASRLPGRKAHCYHLATCPSAQAERHTAPLDVVLRAAQTPSLAARGQLARCCARPQTPKAARVTRGGLREHPGGCAESAPRGHLAIPKSEGKPILFSHLLRAHSADLRADGALGRERPEDHLRFSVVEHGDDRVGY